MAFTILFGVFIVGAALGSFAVASVWRLRALQLKADKAAGEHLKKTDIAFSKKFQQPFGINDHSQCLHCNYQLRWFDLIPIISWVYLRGKCRKCHKGIGYSEITAEVGLGLAFALSYFFWPMGTDSTTGIVTLVLWLIMLVLLCIHFFYDLKWQLLPDRITVAFFAVASVYWIISWAINPIATTESVAIDTIGSLVILPGFYGLLYVVSKGNWIGFGDIKMLVPMALVVASWQNSFLLLFLANFIGCLIILPAMLSKKMARGAHVPFGPFLIIGFFFVVLWGNTIMDIYLRNILFQP
jgi:prepilin signal peptidase PulO-like enzyme (type II secretory pathway)